MTGDLVAFLRARLVEDALWATEASRCRGNLPPDGAHWQWEDTETDQPVTVDPGSDDVLVGVGLWSVEQYPGSAISGEFPQLAVSTDEIDAVVAGHIARHDPARVLAEVDAKRRIIDASTVACPLDCARDHTFSGSCALRWMGPVVWGEDGTPWVRDADGATVLAPPVTDSYVLRLLALPYRDHPDYQPVWAPEVEG